jgi:CBS domain-containing protein
MAIGEICSREVVFAHRGMTVKAAAQLMREYHIGALVVVDELEARRVPAGIITDRDIAVSIVAKGLDPDDVRVEDAMVSEPAVVRESDGVAETIELMRAKAVRRLPVVDDAGSLVGIITADDFIDLLAEEMMGLARMLTREQRREAETRKV